METPVVGSPSAAAPSQAAATKLSLGRLEAVKIRELWADEARDFTPWLAEEENLSLLGETIGSNLELVGVEQRVGPFKADIVARDGEQIVIIENQLDATDHKHLGQLLVYAAGRTAHKVVWVAKQVTDEYRKVIDWLNEETTTSFWALEVELWRIGNSAAAPKFNVVCEPNELTKPTGVIETAELSGTKLLQLDFWKGFAQFLEDTGGSFNARKPFPQHWYDLSIGTSRAHVSLTALVAKSGRIGCELYVGHSQADVIFDRLQQEQELIEGELGPLEWHPLPEKKSCRIVVYRQGDIENRDSWPELFAWLLERAEKFKSVFASRVKAVELPPAAGEFPVIAALEPGVAEEVLIAPAGES